MRASLLSLLAASSMTAAAYAQPTAFTYQGRLKNGSAASSGLHDFRFRLFSTSTGGVPVSPTQCIDNVAVTEGLFTTPVDFGLPFTNTTQLFLEIDVRADTGLGCADSTGYITLAPRQLMSATPQATHARSAFALDAADGSPLAAVSVDNSGNVGIGTATPGVPLQIARDLDAIMVLQDTGPASTQSGYVGYWNNAGTETAWVGYGTPGSPRFSITNSRAGGHINLLPGSGGGVGIGTSAPTHSLHIATTQPTLALQDTDSTTQQVGYVSYRDSAGAERAWVGYGTAGSPHFSIINARSGGNIVLTPLGGGVVQVPVLEITGADLAEKFPASEKLEPGMVVAIDREHAGQLCLSRTAYNRAVAGVVSGANDFAAGAILGNLPGHDDAPAVALSGRVYVWCDASDHPIEPGDFLTTSDIPGHAMRAADTARAQGSVIGKAMTPLARGRGLVLVLVNLQ